MHKCGSYSTFQNILLVINSLRSRDILYLCGNLLWQDHTSSAFPESSSYSFLETTRITRGWSITYEKHCSAFEVKFRALAQYRKAILEKSIL